MLIGTEVALTDMLICRERRAYKQQEYLEKYHRPLISFCMNIPGPIKTTFEIRHAFEEGKTEILNALTDKGFAILDSDEIHATTGDELIFCINCQDAHLLKNIATQIEETHPLGRLFDIDIIDVDGTKLSRSSFRKCLICDRQAQDCAASRRHSVEEMQTALWQMLTHY